AVRTGGPGWRCGSLWRSPPVPPHRRREARRQMPRRRMPRRLPPRLRLAWSISLSFESPSVLHKSHSNLHAGYSSPVSIPAIAHGVPQRKLGAAFQGTRPPLCRRKARVLQGRLITSINRIRANHNHSLDRFQCSVRASLTSARPLAGNDVRAPSCQRVGPVLSLGQRQDIAVGILEPSDLAGSGRDPYAELGLLQPRKALERHAFVLQVPRGRFDVGNLPAEQREWKWREAGDLLHEQGRPTGLEYQRKLSVVLQFEAEYVAIEGLGPLRVDRGRRRHDVVIFECHADCPF